MATNQAVWGIEIGQCALKAIRLRHDPQSNKVVALAFDYIEHPKILSQPDADPDALSREALQTFLSRNPVKGDRVVIGVPGQSGLARFIKLPPVEPARIPEIVKYEARQQIPFALEEVVWDFQTIGEAEEAGGFALETEIGLFAMKRDLIYRFMNPFRETSVEVDVVQMRPLAVYNFAAYDQMPAPGEGEEEEQEEEKEESEYQREELLEKKKEAPKETARFIVLLDMGADNSDLVITDGTRIWQRNLPIGGNHFTRALTKELKLTFAKAEHLKRNATKAQDPRAIFQAMRPVFNELVSDIQRSIGYFSSVHRQSKIAKIIGMGNAFKLPGLQKFLAQNLQYEVEKVEKFQNLKGDQVVSAPAFQENILSFSIVYGLALQGLGVSGVNTSLLPPEITQARMIRRKKPWALSAAAILMAGFTCLFFGNWAQLNAVNSPAFSGPEAKAKDAQDTKTKNKSAYDAIRDAWSITKSRGEQLTENVDKRLEWLEVLEVINKALPNNPANIDRKELKDLKEVQITNISVAWKDDLKSEWFDKVSNDPATPFAAMSLHPLDKAQPPTGSGWVFTLDGYHFNKLERRYTMYALLDLRDALQQATVREYGIRAAMVIENVTSAWVPGQEQKTTAKGRRRAGGDSGGGGLRSGPSGGGGGGMGNRMGGMMGGVSEGRGEDVDAGIGAGGGFGRGGAGDAGGGGVAGEQPQGSDTGGSAPVSNLSQTDFVVQFAWVPTEKKKKLASAWLEELENSPRPNRDIESLLKSERPGQPPARSGGVPGGMPGTPQGQPAPPTQPGAMPPSGGPPQGGVPGATQPPGGNLPTGQPPAAQPPGQTPAAPPGGNPNPGQG